LRDATKPLPDDKSALRAAMRKRRKAVHGPAGALALAAQAKALPLPATGAIALYQAAGSEIDPAMLARALHEAGRSLCLPVTLAPEQPLIFRRWQPGDALAPDALGMEAPLADAPLVRPAVVLAPLVAFDPLGGRLGQGGGFYDRTLAALRADGGVVAIGLAYDEQQVERLDRGPFDQ
jgi:5-formyltetrahydrofolate cyclo-ligase